MSVSRQKVLAGRKAIDAHRTAHTKMSKHGWYKGISEDHIPLLKASVKALEALGFTSDEIEFEPKKTEILAKFWAASDLLNIQELGFADRDDFEKNATEADRETLEEMWQ